MSAGLQIIDAGGTDRVISALQIIDSGGVDRTLTELRVFDAGGVDRVIWSSGGSTSTLAVAVTPGSTSGFTRGSGTATSGSVTAYPAGGTAPYSFLWSLEDYDSSTPPIANAPRAANTTFTQNVIRHGASYSATFKITVTDSATPTPATAIAEVPVTWADLS